jgi:hypothetical protein
MNRVRLLVFNAALPVLDYRVPQSMKVQFGSVVVAPLGPRKVLGIVWETERLPAAEVPDSKLRPLLEVLPVPPLRAELRRLIEWTADYYCASLPSVARMVVASGPALRGGSTITEYRLTGEISGRITPQRQAALAALEGEQGSIRELSEIAGVSEGVLRGMVGARRAAPVVADVVRTVGIDAAEAIVSGGPTAATTFLRKEMGAGLVNAMIPELTEAMRIAENPILNQAIAALSGVTIADAAHALAIEADNAIWLEIGAAEAAIRKNPQSTNDPVLIGAFKVL